MNIDEVVFSEAVDGAANGRLASYVWINPDGKPNMA